MSVGLVTTEIIRPCHVRMSGGMSVWSIGVLFCESHVGRRGRLLISMVHSKDKCGTRSMGDGVDSEGWVQTLDKFSCVALAGVATEYIKYEEAEGGLSDIQQVLYFTK